MAAARPQTVAEKIFSAHAGRPVYAGESVVARVDVVMATDGSGPLALDFFRKMGGTRTFDGTKVLMVLDHYVPCPNDKVAALQDQMREFARAGRERGGRAGARNAYRRGPARQHARNASLFLHRRHREKHSEYRSQRTHRRRGLGASTPPRSRPSR
jgi:hypothetical protein